jgi:hypothetical protein
MEIQPLLRTCRLTGGVRGLRIIAFPVIPSLTHSQARNLQRRMASFRRLHVHENTGPVTRRGPAARARVKMEPRGPHTIATLLTSIGQTVSESLTACHVRHPGIMTRVTVPTAVTALAPGASAHPKNRPSMIGARRSAGSRGTRKRQRPTHQQPSPRAKRSKHRRRPTALTAARGATAPPVTAWHRPPTPPGPRRLPPRRARSSLT